MNSANRFHYLERTTQRSGLYEYVTPETRQWTRIYSTQASARAGDVRQGAERRDHRAAAVPLRELGARLQVGGQLHQTEGEPTSHTFDTNWLNLRANNEPPSQTFEPHCSTFSKLKFTWVGVGLVLTLCDTSHTRTYVQVRYICSLLNL